jgi:glycosyltransferase involved in cell wall biosynthesis
MPTWNSEEVLAQTLDCLAGSAERSSATIRRIVLVDNRSSDETVPLAQAKADEHGWDLVVVREDASLPKAREIAIRNVDASWFLFLDDDVRITEDYLSELLNSVAPSVGAVQGRKVSSAGPPWEWTQRRVYRGGTHATLIRTEAVRGVSIPEGVKVLEDEYIRRQVEGNGYLWVFNHQARFDHECMERHPLGVEQGYIAGKYGLMPFYSIVLMIGDALVSGKSPFGRIGLMIGWMVGAGSRRDEE